jgi:hypothetical protein
VEFDEQMESIFSQLTENGLKWIRKLRWQDFRADIVRMTENMLGQP